ncbi:MAG: hypothetical protein KKH08_07120, partial [Candidatus Omnitrophica bacterium]|nr:hypothetical protein [Candidatus Omnitrophota bacterium]
LKNNSGRIRIEIPELHLLPGKYSVISNGKPLKEFLVYSDKQDHGIVYMPHKWVVKIPKEGNPA